jgi:hypothetical protein
LLGQRKRAFVVGSDGLVEQAAVAQAHLSAGVTKNRHRRLKADAGVDQRGGVGVAQLVGCDVPEPGLVGGAAKLCAQRVGGEPLAVVGEQELDGAAVTRVGQRPAG